MPGLLLSPSPTRPSPQLSVIDWGEAIAIAAFFGREQELETLQRWVVEERCRVVTIIGLGGMGKSSLAMYFAQLALPEFDTVLFRSLQNGLPIGDALDQIIDAISDQPITAPQQVADKIGLLVQLFRKRRCLLILDNFETILQPDALAGTYRNGYAEYGALLQGLSEREHQSCLILTSREKPVELAVFEGPAMPVRSLSLNGLDVRACINILNGRDIVATADDLDALTQLYGGNPLALHLVVEPIRELFNGDVGVFLTTGDAFFNGLGTLLLQQCVRSTPLEQTILYWLAIDRGSVSFKALLANQSEAVPQRAVLVALESLRRRMLIERGPNQSAFALQPVILEFMTEQLIHTVCQELVEQQPRLICSHALIQATALDYVRRSQERLIAMPLLERLVSACGSTRAAEQLLLTLLSIWRNQPPIEQGYGPGNIINLLRLLRGHLRDLDLTQLTIRQAYLSDVELHDTRLANATIQDCIFAETFGALTAVAVSGTGEYWVAASRRGEVWVWAGGGQTLIQAWRAHTDMIWTIAFSPDGHTLATGSWDGMLKLWNVDTGQLLWANRHTSHINNVVFAPDGRMLASGGDDAVVQLWDVETGATLQTLAHPGPVSGTGVTWSPDGRLLATGDLEGCIRLWAIDATAPAACVQTIMGHSNWVDGLAFAPDSSMLASASFDGTVKLWDVTSGQLREKLVGHTDRVSRVVWSPDGRILASSGRDQTIWFWNVEQGNSRMALRGHIAGVVGLAFLPDNHSLLSGSEDGTLRVWDTVSRECTYVLRGYAGSLYDVDWNPDGTQLVSGGSDTLVTIYNLADAVPPRVLRGHSGAVLGVSWSADGRWLASSELDNAIRLWDPVSGTCHIILQRLDDTGNSFSGVAWSPDGQQLASGTFRLGVLVFDTQTHSYRWAGQPFPTWIRAVAWSPDRAYLAGGGDDGVVYVWNAADGMLCQRLEGHTSKITSIAWNHTGTQLVSASSGSAGGELRVWVPLRAECLYTITGRPGIYHAVVWGASEELVISGGGNGNLRWWDVRRGVCIRIQEAHQGTVQALRQSPDGTKLASCGDDGAVMIWDLATGLHLRTLRRDRPYERLDLTRTSGLTEAQKTTLRNLGALEHAMTTQATTGSSATPVHTPDNPRRVGPDQPVPLRLPYQPTSFVGRTAELDQIEQLLTVSTCRLLTLLGPGGIGKTRLAVESAARLAATFADGVALAPLAAISAPNQIVSVIGDVLKLSFGGQPDPAAYLLKYLHERNLLLVLDNFEHVLDGAELVADILAHAPHVTILITSRERLRIQAEWLFEVGGLSYPTAGPEIATREMNSLDLADYSAIQLFMQRAQQIQPGFRLSEDTLTAVVRICQHVAGMPLAVELAAASLRSLPIMEIERQIQASQIELQSVFRDVPARHRSMRAVFDHSWKLLSDAEQVLFRRMAVFRGGWTLAAAEHVVEATQPMLLALIDKSLIRYSSELARSLNADIHADTQAPRFVMLEPLREYALERLAADPDAEAIRRRYAHYFTGLAQAVSAQLFQSQHDAVRQQLVVEHDNFRTALTWSLHTGEATIALQLGAALADFWRICGYVSEGRRWLEALLETFPTQRKARLRILHRATRFAGDQGDYRRSIDIAEEGLALARTLGDHEWTADFLTILGTLTVNHQQDIPRAKALFEEALSLYRIQGSADGISNALLNLGRVVAFAEGDLANARLLFAECLILYRQLNDTPSTVLVLLHQGAIAAMAEEVDQATSAAVAALQLAWPNQFLPLVGYGLALLAIAAIMQQEQERGARLYAAATQLLNDLGVVMPPSEQARYTHWLDVARQGVDSVRFESAWMEGLALSHEQAVRYALDL